MCSDRLAEGEAPACVQACPTRPSASASSTSPRPSAAAAAADAALVPGGAAVAAHRADDPLPLDRRRCPPMRCPPTTSRCVPVARPPAAGRHAGAHPAAGRRVRRRPGCSAASPRRRSPTGSGRSTPASPLGVGLLALGASVLHLGRPAVRLAGGDRAAPLVAQPRDRRLRRVRRPGRGSTPAPCCSTRRRPLVRGARRRRRASPGSAASACSVMIYAVTAPALVAGRPHAARSSPSPRCHRRAGRRRSPPRSLAAAGDAAASARRSPSWSGPLAVVLVAATRRSSSPARPPCSATSRDRDATPTCARTALLLRRRPRRRSRSALRRSASSAAWSCPLVLRRPSPPATGRAVAGRRRRRRRRSSLVVAGELLRALAVLHRRRRRARMPGGSPPMSAADAIGRRPASAPATGALTARAAPRARRVRPRPGARAAQARRRRRRWSAASARPAARSTSTCRTARPSTSRPTTDYPVNLGWPAPRAGRRSRRCDADDRATTPLLRDDRRPAASRSTGTTALDDVRRPVQGDPGPSTAPSRSRSCRTGQIPTEEMALLGALAKFGMGMVHGDGNTRQCMATSVVAYKQSFGFDAPPYTYADFEESDVIVLVGSNLVHRPPDHVAARAAATRTSPRSSSSIPARPRRRWPPPSTSPSRPKSDLVAALRPRPPAHRAGLDRPGLRRRAHRRASTSSPRTSRAFTPERVGAATGLRRRRSSSSWRDTIARGQAGLVLVDDGREPEPRGRAHRAGDHQPGPDDRQHRPARHRRQLDHRPVQRHGLAAVQQHDQPARRPRLHRRRRTAPRSPASSASTSAASPTGPAWPTTRSSRASTRGTIKGLWVIATNTAHSWINQDRRPRRCSTSSTSSSCRTCTPPPRRRSAPTSSCPPPAGARRRARSSTPSAASASIKRVAPAPGPGAGRLLRSSSSSPRPGAAATCSREWRTPEAVFQILQRLSAGRPCDITGIAGYAIIDAPRRRPVAVPRRRGRRRRAGDASAGCSPTAGSSRPTAGPGSSFDDAAAVRRAASTPRYPLVLLTGRGSLEPVAHPDPHRRSRRCCARSYPETPYVEIHPDDADALGIAPRRLGRRARRARGSMRARAFVTADRARRARSSCPMHYADDQPAHLPRRSTRTPASRPTSTPPSRWRPSSPTSAEHALAAPPRFGACHVPRATAARGAC